MFGPKGNRHGLLIHRMQAATCAATVAAFFATPPIFAAFSKVPGIDDPRIKQVAVSPKDPRIIAASSENTLYLSRDGGRHFAKTAVLKDEQINYLFMDRDLPDTVYVAGTRNGYMAGTSTERIFTARENEELHFIVRHADQLYAGTSEGLYRADHALQNWKPVPGLRNRATYSMETAGRDGYLACEDGVYRYRADQPPERLFTTPGNHDSGTLRPNLVRIDPMSPAQLWLCTSKGVYSSSDRGMTWTKFYISGTGNGAVNCLAQFSLDGNHFYLCGEAGFFKVNTNTGEARALFEGLASTKIHWVDLTPSGDIYLATDQGLYRQDSAALLASTAKTGSLNDILKGEPSIHDVQEAAMRYNSVHPDKTGRWRKRLKYRALMPRLSVDYDKTIGSSFTSSGYYYAQGPYDWGVSLTWDLDELIWNSYEDDIDNRTKLTTQLRMDILDEVNRLYFERLRLKHEIAVERSGMADTTMKELRLYELTATLDGYTGGLYTRQAHSPQSASRYW